MRYKLEMSYDGTNYCGFQSQINGLSVQDVLEKAIRRIFQEEIRVIMASRTDSGVHALKQVVHFDSAKEIDSYSLKGSINALLPKDVHINNVEIVSEDFHARFSSHHKTYVYIINIGEYNVFLKNKAYQCFYDLNVELMREASKLYIGKRDFGSFNTSSYEEYPNQVREILSFDIDRKDDLLIIKVVGTGFLKNMVRIMVGTLVDLGRGKKTLEEFKEMLEKPSKDKRRNNIDPCGLYLVDIDYTCK